MQWMRKKSNLKTADWLLCSILVDLMEQVVLNAVSVHRLDMKMECNHKWYGSWCDVERSGLKKKRVECES